MADDDSYASFLDKANQDTGASKAPKKEEEVSVLADGELPKPIQDVVSGEGVWYVSESDERFEGVSLSLGDGDGDDLKSLIGSKSSGSRVASLSPKEFDPKDQYKEVLEAVKKATGEVKVFRVEGKGTRVEYWVLGVDKTKGRAVGFRAKAVES